MKSPELIDPIDLPETKQMTIEQALPRIMEIRQRIALMGANDSEFYSVDEIIHKMEKVEIEPAVALEEVTRIFNSKQDYH